MGGIGGLGLGEITFIRHGQASFGTDDYDRLSNLGHQQSAWLGQHLANETRDYDQVICGSLRRHRETLVGIQKHLPTINVTEDSRLNEMRYHELEEEWRELNAAKEPETKEELAAMFTNVMQAWQRGELRHAPESFHSFQSRIVDAITEAAQQDKRTLIVSSGGPICMTMRMVLGLDIHALTELILWTYNASYSRFRLIGGRLHLSQFNAIPHLEHPDRQYAQTYL